MFARKYTGDDGARGSLRIVAGKLRRRFCHVAGGDFDGEVDGVKEGHFAVMAVTGKESERFMVGIECLARPEFVRLLERAEEEYGFRQTGAIAVPCRPEELQRILSS